MFLGDHRVGFHLDILVSKLMTKKLTVILKIARGNHDDIIKMRNFYVHLFSPFLLLVKTTVHEKLCQKPAQNFFPLNSKELLFISCFPKPVQRMC